ncbi:hypothetical protein EI42_00052 [Thermosporothrix hazakensis]|jgi:hypothetical protein|uniref:Uncharacterized protein n=2 Tax=Thermosporothrix TaxID=768650 RepID=A0A326UBY5_THEHA|nr:hypothetical protein [Thermosporothrix hazakensis]PZW35888.1 hypothetical protein EI42_00052 [Thermosporothrix hazakensis]BBH88354.1 hypothetical protein KTC_31050 [Thermosporothrix sp. COM3]GCE46541.1 hypothetical protein KTH_14100 [Thermosporothrix hazakensis]
MVDPAKEANDRPVEIVDPAEEPEHTGSNINILLPLVLALVALVVFLALRRESEQSEE